MLSFSSFARDSSDLIAMSVLAKRAALARTIICNSHATQPEMSSSAATRRPNAAVRNPTPRHQHGARSMHFGAFARASHPHLWRGTAAPRDLPPPRCWLQWQAVHAPVSGRAAAG
jgi:hypothetical protein